VTSKNQQALGLKGPGLVAVVTFVSLIVLCPVALFSSGMPGVLAVLATTVGCGVPGVFSLMLARTWTSSNAGLLTLTFIRMGFGMALAVFVKFNWPGLGFADFYVWLAIVYMVSLAVDTLAVMQQFTLTEKVS
jgi:hypothetical protein